MEENMKYNFNNRETEIVFSTEFSFPEKKGVVIIDKRVLSLYDKSLQKFLEDKPIFVFEATVKNKNLQTISTIYDFFQKVFNAYVFPYFRMLYHRTFWTNGNNNFRVLNFTFSTLFTEPVFQIFRFLSALIAKFFHILILL